MSVAVFFTIFKILLSLLILSIVAYLFITLHESMVLTKKINKDRCKYCIFGRLNDKTKKHECIIGNEYKPGKKACDDFKYNGRT